MSKRLYSNMATRGEGRKRLCLLATVFLLAVLVPAQVLAQDSALIRSLILPGAGQAHKGHYTKAALFAGATMLSAAGLVVATVHYNQSVDRYRSEKRIFQSYQDRLDQGEVVSIDDINSTFSSMQKAFDQADSRLLWRNTFLTALLTTYTLNVIDVIMSKPHEVDAAQRYSIEADGERVLVTTRIGF